MRLYGQIKKLCEAKAVKTEKYTMTHWKKKYSSKQN